MIRLPFDPLEREVNRQLDRPATNEELVVILALGDERRVQWYRVKGMTVWAADQCAIRIGLHPISIWGLSAWLGTISEADIDRDPEYPPPKIVTLS